MNSQLQLGLAHRTIRWCTGQCPVPQASFRWSSWSQEAMQAYGYNSLDCPVVHRTVRWVIRGELVALGKRISGVRLKFTWLSGEPTVASTNGRPRNLRATRGHANGRLGTSDYPVCTGQCLVHQPIPGTNGRLLSVWKEIKHQTWTIVVRWCIGLSGAPPDRRQDWPSKLVSNGSYLPWGYKRDP
jgi:hypothetical protein